MRESSRNTKRGSAKYRANYGESVCGYVVNRWFMSAPSIQGGGGWANHKPRSPEGVAGLWSDQSLPTRILRYRGYVK